MAYEKQNFTDGQVLTAEQLKHMEEGIINAVSCETQSLTDEQKAQARSNIGAVDASVVGDIEIALDSIIAIQKELIGGDSA